MYTLPSGNPVGTGSVASSTVHNATLTDIATALTASIAKDGQTPATADLPMATFKHTNVGNAAARNQYLAAGQFQDGGISTLGSVSGTNTITAALTPAIPAYVAGMKVTFKPANTNTDAVTIAINGLSAVDVKKADDVALIAGDLVQNVPAVLIYDGSKFFLLNPASLKVTRGDFTATMTGVTGTVTGTAHWRKVGKVVTLQLPSLLGTSNSAFKTYTGLPSELAPAYDTNVMTSGLNNSGVVAEAIPVQIEASATIISFFRLASDGLWTTSGTCVITGPTLTYEAES